MDVRAARPGELPAVMTVLDGGLLDVAADRVRAAIDAGTVLVAVEDDRVLGALVLDPPARDTGASDAREREAGDRVEAVAVRRRRRGQGVGTALVRAAADRHGRLVAGFDGRVRPFWASLGFRVEPTDEPGRYVGTYEGR